LNGNYYDMQMTLTMIYLQANFCGVTPICVRDMVSDLKNYKYNSAWEERKKNEYDFVSEQCKRKCEIWMNEKRKTWTSDEPFFFFWEPRISYYPIRSN
jgi:hypothetical protein